MIHKARISVALLTLSAAGFIGIVSGEDYVGEAMIPTQGDRPTVGYGSTFHANGKPVQLGDKLSPARALVTTQVHISREEEIFRQSLDGTSLNQAEFDLYMDFVYQYGTAKWLGSSMRRQLQAGNYPAACDALLQWKRVAGYDCSIPGNKRCWGVWTRQLERHQKCKGAL